MKRAKHNLSYTRLLSCDLGELVPVGLTEVLPGDTIQHNTSLLLRCAPLTAPVMHPIHVRIHHWFVPHRLIWDNWEDFITGGPAGVSVPTFPTIQMPGGGVGAAVGTLADYLGVPTAFASADVSALPFRAYAMIWNEFYRDQDLQTALVLSTANGSDTTTSTALQNCAWEKDYFTSARPWEQKGPSITIPLGTRANVSGIGLAPGATFPTAGGTFKDATTSAAGVVWANSTDETLLQMRGTLASASGIPDIYADLTGASAVTVNLLREALALQRFEEARARYGSRYTEYLQYLGVRSQDSRLQLPEYLGGGQQTIQFSEVLQTAPGTDPVGDMKGHGIAAMKSNRYRRFIPEHGYVMSLLSVRPKTIYMDGLFRHWNRRTKEDYFQLELQHIGQQEIQNKEVYLGAGTPDGIWGYQDRYDEYRRSESSVHGEFRSTLNNWHFARDFAGGTALNAAFVKCVPTEVPFAVPAEDALYIHARHSMMSRRIVAAKGSSFIY